MVSQAVGFFSLENGVSVASLVVAAGLPLIVEVAFLFDLLVAVVVFGVLIRVHHGRTQTLSTESSIGCGGSRGLGPPRHPDRSLRGRRRLLVGAGKVGRLLTVASGALTFGLATLLVPTASPRPAGWLRADALSVVFLVAVAFLYAATAMFAVRLRPAGRRPAVGGRYSRRFFAGLNLFAWSMAMAPS